MISVIIVNFNGEHLIADCLTALEAQTFRDFETVIVDNGSVDRSSEVIMEFMKRSPMGTKIKFVPLKKNLGFAGGNIEALEYASGKYLALLNNDTEPHEGWLEALSNAMEGDPLTGICASKLVSCRDGTIDSAGDGYTRSLKGFKRGEGSLPARFDEPMYVFGACAGAALYRRSMLEEIGFLDNDFFLIHEDTDLNIRAKLAGWKILFVPTAVVRHKVTSSIGYMSDMQTYYTLRNSELVRMKDIPLSAFVLCLPEFLVGFLSELIYFGLKHGKIRLFFRAKRDAVRLLPRMLKKRRSIMARRKMSTAALIKEMTPMWERDFLRRKLTKFLRD